MLHLHLPKLPVFVVSKKSLAYKAFVMLLCFHLFFFKGILGYEVHSEISIFAFLCVSTLIFCF